MPPRSGAVMLQDSLQREVRRAVAAAGIDRCPAYLLAELGEMGLRVAVVDAASGASIAERGDGRLAPHMLDLTLADHLVRIGRVTRPESTGWAAELIDLMPAVRERLAVADGAFAMGPEHVSMFRMSRADCVTALETELTGARDVIARTLAESTVDIGAVVFMPDHELWPGLAESVGAHVEVPVVILGDIDDMPDADPTDRGRHTVDAPEEHAGTAEDQVGTAVTEPFTAVRPDEKPTDAVQLAGAATRAPDPVAPVATWGDDPRADDARVAVTGDHDVVPSDPAPGHPVNGAGPRYYMPPTGDVRVSGARSYRRLAIGAVALGGAVVVGGAILAVPWVGGTDAASAPAVAGFATAPSSSAAAPPADSTAPSTPTRTPIDLGAARLPATQYTAPPTASGGAGGGGGYVAPGQTRRAPAPRYIPRRRTIPNPIPGLPPIVLP
ncbi:hypothetical protein [Williamsia deligens]|uniref:Uncharacterized protein n=1 Tax=Williamsia deligens TaxID=321325 RepID=A0ABW3G873_9NOCA|nr:hypothetical protein [Williamsia deligens]